MLTQTSPCPQPGAGGLDAAAALAFFAGALLTAAGLADAEVFGLNNSPSENLEGDGEGLVAVAALLRPAFCLGVAAGTAAGLAVATAWVSLRLRFAFRPAAGDSAAAGEAAVSLVAVAVSAFLRPRCFAGDSPGVGD